ncbi:MAG: Prodigiosin synthesizing transferase PigC [Anaerolineales bacterium]|nr:Prodigiosin synthesizing transferase PigC [Anaerolineales bacterium]
MIYPFDSATLPTLAEVGGKGLSLMRMTHAGLPVPSGFVCAVAFFEPWLTTLQTTPEWTAVQTAIQNDEDLAPSTTALKAACAELALTTSQEGQLTEALQALPKDSFFATGEGVFAARSSSPEEDLEGASFAGGYKTTLGVTEDALLDAIRDSFASAFDERVFVYKQQHGFATDTPRIAVVVQQQIAADSAGVGFSLNPHNNDYWELIVNVDRERYRAAEKMKALRWGPLLRRGLGAFWYSRRLIGQTIVAFLGSKRFYRHYERVIDETVRQW